MNQNINVTGMAGFCGICKSFFQIDNKLLFVNLLEMKSIIDTHKNKPSEILAGIDLDLKEIITEKCLILYPKRAAYRQILVGRLNCNADQIIMEIIAEKYNLTVSYRNRNEALSQTLRDTIKNYHSIVVLDMTETYEASSFYARNKFLSFNSIIRFVYCRCRRDIFTEQFNYLFWFTPFDKSSWILIGCSLLMLSLILKGQFMDIFGALLMRQQLPQLNYNKWIIIVLLVSVVITFEYEGFISSRIIVPPPIHVYKSLKDLIRNGCHLYKINPSISKYLSEFYKKESLTQDEIQSLQYADTRNYLLKNYFTLPPQCNVTVEVSRVNEENINADLYKRDPKKIDGKCFLLKEIYLQIPNFHHFSGFGIWNLIKLVLYCREAGLISWLNTHTIYTDSHGYRRYSDISKYKEAQPMPFQLFDLKILSIFMICGVGLLISCLLFLLKCSCNYSVRLPNFVRSFWFEFMRNVCIFVFRFLNIRKNV